MLVKVFMYSRAKYTHYQIRIFSYKNTAQLNIARQCCGVFRRETSTFCSPFFAVFDRCVFMPILLGEFLFQQMFYFIRCYIV